MYNVYAFFFLWCRIELERGVSLQSPEEQYTYRTLLKKICFTTNIVYLFIRILYLIFFITTKSYVLVYFDIASIVMYVFTFLIVKKNKFYIYSLFCGNEFLVLMSLSTIYLGFSSGFQLNIIGICVVAFFAAYFSKGKGIRNSLIWTVMSVAIYLFLHFYMSFHTPIYPMEAWFNISFYAFHTIMVFAFIAIYLLVFVRYTRSLEERILSESRIDFLTKTHNRHDLYSYLDSITEKKEYSLAIFDIDDFKKINDVYGHICGDYILKELAFITSNTLRDSFVSRYGGEEFIIIAKESNDDFYARLEDLRKYIASHVFQFNDQIIKITITIGIGNYEENMSIEAWIDTADSKLYQGKNSGKNKTVM